MARKSSKAHAPHSKKPRIRPPLAGWIGGKSQTAARIIERFPPHIAYCEVFAGAAWLLFKKTPSKAEIINDLNFDVVNLYRVIRWHFEELARQFDWQILSREDWMAFNKADPSSLTDIQRAAQFYYLQRLSFGGKVKGRSLGTAATHRPRLHLDTIKKELELTRERLTNVFVEHLDFAECIKRYDRPETFFYLDPPYHGVEDYYGDGLFNRDDFKKLADQLAGIQGKFLMSINDAPLIRELFSGFKIETIDLTYTTGQGRPKVSELIITNY